MRKLFTKLVVCMMFGCTVVVAQEPSAASTEKYLLTAVVAVAFQYPRVEIIAPANKHVLADVHSICVLPFDGFTAQSVTGALPDLSPISEQLSKSKLLRQQRFQVGEELGKRGFLVIDCIATPSPNTARLLVTSLRGGGFDDSFATIYWTLYAGEDHIIVNKGEKELMGLARPAYRQYPLFAEDVAKQVSRVVDVARAQ
jgi:hypothetical protein